MILTPITEKLAEINSRIKQTVNFNESMLCALWEDFNAPGMQSDLVSTLGKKAVSYLQLYAALRGIVEAEKPNHCIPAVDMTVFKPQPDGSVIYVAPVKESDLVD